MPFTIARQDTPKMSVLFHFTCMALLPGILKNRFLKTSASNFDLGQPGLYPVVWLTSLPSPENMGLFFDPDIPDLFNKTYIRITVRKKPNMVSWDEWSDAKGMDKELKRALIKTASAEDTYKTWYVSEQIITTNDMLLIENLATGKTLFQRNAKGGLSPCSNT